MWISFSLILGFTVVEDFSDIERLDDCKISILHTCMVFVFSAFKLEQPIQLFLHIQSRLLIRECQTAFKSHGKQF